MQGTDVRLTGHFVYCTLPDFREGPPIRCTNRAQASEMRCIASFRRVVILWMEVSATHAVLDYRVDG